MRFISKVRDNANGHKIEFVPFVCDIPSPKGFSNHNIGSKVKTMLPEQVDFAIGGVASEGFATNGATPSRF